MDKQEKKTFREQLLSQEKSDTQLQEKFQLETKKMFTEKLKISQRLAYFLTSLLIAFVTFIFWIFAKIFEEMQIKYEISTIEPLRLASMWAMFLGMALIILSIWPAIRGKVGLRFYPKAIRFISWIMIMVVVLLSFAVVNYMRNETDLQVADSTIDLLGAAIMSILFIIMSIYMLLSGRIDKGYIDNKSKTLELEYRIAELEEKLKQDK